MRQFIDTCDACKTHITSVFREALEIRGMTLIVDSTPLTAHADLHFCHRGCFENWLDYKLDAPKVKP